ncbi:hypothetical protein AB0F81_38335 [Actinoplanes sp. NPDC024001]|uniref:hypothetical protein n=1 Tax=Actinoplanes sp. NPDC024001 TaxID=3154598 RepID=UPI0033C4612B
MSKSKLFLWVTGSVAVTWVVAAFVPLVSPYARYPAWVVRCGGMPVAGTTFAAAYSYQLPTDERYAVSPFTNHFFCTAQEAEAAGFSHHP